MKEKESHKQALWRYILFLLTIGILPIASHAMKTNIGVQRPATSYYNLIEGYVVPDTSIKQRADTIIGGKVFIWVEHMPRFPGSHSEEESQEMISKYLSDHIRYPVNAWKNNIQGTVYVQFFVEGDGRITHVKAVNFVGGGLMEEAVRVIKYMPEWIPGSQKGKPVTVQFSIPIRFVLNQQAGH